MDEPNPLRSPGMRTPFVVTGRARFALLGPPHAFVRRSYGKRPSWSLRRMRRRTASWSIGIPGGVQADCQKLFGDVGPLRLPRVTIACQRDRVLRGAHLGSDRIDLAGRKVRPAAPEHCLVLRAGTRPRTRTRERQRERVACRFLDGAFRLHTLQASGWRIVSCQRTRLHATCCAGTEPREPAKAVPRTSFVVPPARPPLLGSR
jgi:hypothetical protein